MSRYKRPEVKSAIVRSDLLNEESPRRLQKNAMTEEMLCRLHLSTSAFIRISILRILVSTHQEQDYETNLLDFL